jgi:hypothetical protein
MLGNNQANEAWRHQRNGNKAAAKSKGLIHRKPPVCSLAQFTCKTLEYGFNPANARDGGDHANGLFMRTGNGADVCGA